MGVRIEKNEDGSISMHQRGIIDRCLELSGIPTDPDAKTKLHDTPAETDKVLHKDEAGAPRKQDWNYRSKIGCLTYLQGMSRTDLAYSVHQAARLRTILSFLMNNTSSESFDTSELHATKD